MSHHFRCELLDYGVHANKYHSIRGTFHIWFINATYSWFSKAMKVTKWVLLTLLLAVYNTKLIAAECEGKCEQSTGSFRQRGMKHRAILGHSYKNFTLSKSFDCHVKCFDEKCRCQAYQMRNNHCELLDEDRTSAPGDFFKEDGYTYFDMNREYVIGVNKVWKSFLFIYLFLTKILPYQGKWINRWPSNSVPGEKQSLANCLADNFSQKPVRGIRDRDPPPPPPATLPAITLKTPNNIFLPCPRLGCHTLRQISTLIFTVELALKGVLRTRPSSKRRGRCSVVRTLRQASPCWWGPNKGETAAHGCHCTGDMAVRMRNVMDIPRIDVRVC